MRHLNFEDRYFIEKALKKKMSVKDIAESLGFSKVTIYAEIKKGTITQIDHHLRSYRVYLSDAGQRVHDNAMAGTGRPCKLQPDDPYLQTVKDWIVEKRYSPWAARVKIGKNKVCEKTIYNYIYKKYVPGLTVQQLPYATERKKKKEKVVKRVYRIRGKSIEERPAEVMKRDIFGHWEMDTVYSARGDRACLLVLSERMTRQELVVKVPDRTSSSILLGLNRIERKIGVQNFRKTFRSITCDNGVEFSDSAGIETSCRSRRSRTDLYFCHPYSSWERGTNENINRMIRRWVPKGDDFGLYSDSEIQDIQNWINDYPRKIFGGLSSNEYLQSLRC